MTPGMRKAGYATAAFVVAVTGASWFQPPQAAGNGCPERRESTPTTCPEPSEPIKPSTTTTTTEATTTTVPPRPPAVDPTPTVPERPTTTVAPVIGTPAVLDAPPAEPVTGETRYTG